MRRPRRTGGIGPIELGLLPDNFRADAASRLGLTQALGLMNREIVLTAIDFLIRAGFGFWAVSCLRYLWLSLRRGHVYINGQVATRRAEPVGFWLVVVATLGVACISAYVVLTGL